MKGFSFIRHGEKLGIGEDRKSLEESGLTPEQQEKWKEAVERLQLEDPEISYAALPKIEKMAEGMCAELPDDALVVFTATPLPRARLTADLLSTELYSQSEKEGKHISVEYLWEPQEIAKDPESLSSVSMYPPDIVPKIRAFAEQAIREDSALAEYFRDESKGGNRFHPLEDQLIFETTNLDLASEDSVCKKRAELIKKHFETLAQRYAGQHRPVYFYGVGHHQSLISLDVAFNGREKYDSVNDMPKPLALWKANLET